MCFFTSSLLSSRLSTHRTGTSQIQEVAWFQGEQLQPPVSVQNQLASLFSSPQTRCTSVSGLRSSHSLWPTGVISACLQSQCLSLLSSFLSSSHMSHMQCDWSPCSRRSELQLLLSSSAQPAAAAAAISSRTTWLRLRLSQHAAAELRASKTENLHLDQIEASFAAQAPFLFFFLF